MAAHQFLIEDRAELFAAVEAKGYSRSESESEIIYSKTISQALTKYYASPLLNAHPVLIRVAYRLLQDGKPLEKLTREMKTLNDRYRQSLIGWKTKRKPTPSYRQKRWDELQRFKHRHRELINCFMYRADDRLTEGNYSFNLQVASTPKEQKICLYFIRTLAEASNPQGIVRGRRQADKPVQQRNGWIKREVLTLKKRGWSPFEIAREIQKELRNGTWNERSRLQFNIANSTIGKIAGIKISHHPHPN